MRVILVVLIFAFLFAASDVWACSVCQGDPDSELTKGAEAGVLLMVIVTYTVVLGFAGTAVFWFVRSRKMGRI
ncbi:MAG: hypothetical protein MI923_11445 [Phycisphaerales bacterium]|nr:hypothetical protein [Phycisphaerales bacterium]